VAQHGKVKGLAVLAIELTQLNTSDGQRVVISTDSFTKTGPESKGNDAAKVGGGAALGAIIGAILGGVFYGFASGWELVFLLVGLIFGAGVGALVMGMSSLGNPAPGDEPRN
jgi:MFS family permease